MKLNEKIISEVLNNLGMSFGQARSADFKDKFTRFAKTINAMNRLNKDGISTNYILASDGMQHALNEYVIAPHLKQLILPAKVAIADGMMTEDLRNIPYYSSDDDLGDVEIMTPIEFEMLQSMFYIMIRTEAPEFVNVHELKDARLNISDIQERLAVFEGYSTVIGKILFSKITGSSVGPILTKAPVTSMIPIVVNVYFEKEYTYNVKAEEVVVNYFIKQLLLSK